MQCPNCNAETSEMLTNCEWCGAPIVQGASPPGDAFAAPPPAGYVPPGDVSAGLPEPAGNMPAPSDASYSAYGGPVSEWPPPAAGGRPAQEPKKAWYLTPWAYAAALVIAIAVVGFLFLAGGAKGYPELVVRNLPTLLNVYTDT